MMENFLLDYEKDVQDQSSQSLLLWSSGHLGSRWYSAGIQFHLILKDLMNWVSKA